MFRPTHPRLFHLAVYNQFVAAFYRARTNGKAMRLEVGIINHLRPCLQVTAGLVNECPFFIPLDVVWQQANIRYGSLRWFELMGHPCKPLPKRF